MVVKITGLPLPQIDIREPCKLLTENTGRYFNNMDPEYCLFPEELNPVR
jgi:hypothetical protein